MPSPQALKAATAYLTDIDGDDFGTPDGHDLEDLAGLIDRVTKLPELMAAVQAARPVLEHTAHFMAQFNRKPLRTGDVLYGIHCGTEYEAELKRSVLGRSADALHWIDEAVGVKAQAKMTPFQAKVLKVWANLWPEARSVHKSLRRVAMFAEPDHRLAHRRLVGLHLLGNMNRYKLKYIFRGIPGEATVYAASEATARAIFRVDYACAEEWLSIELA